MDSLQRLMEVHQTSREQEETSKIPADAFRTELDKSRSMGCPLIHSLTTWHKWWWVNYCITFVTLDPCLFRFWMVLISHSLPIHTIQTVSDVFSLVQTVIPDFFLHIPSEANHRSHENLFHLVQIVWNTIQITFLEMFQSDWSEFV